MRIKKLNEWKCDIDIDDAGVYVEPTGALRDMIDCFKLIYNPRTGCYDCDGDVDLYEYYDRMDAAEKKAFDKAFVNDGKMTIRFGTVKGDFFLPGETDNKYVITSLEGCPETVGGKFDCGYNQLTSLEYCPKTVGGYFSCCNNQLISLEGCPEKVSGNFWCNNNRLASLKGCPKTVDGDFWCNNNQLTSLKGCPESVGGYFSCSYNQLTSLEGCPKKVGDDFYCRYNKKKFTEKDVTAVCNVKKQIYV